MIDLHVPFFCALLNSPQDWHDKTLWFICEEMPGHQRDTSPDHHHQCLWYHYLASSGNHSIILWKLAFHWKLLSLLPGNLLACSGNPDPITDSSSATVAARMVSIFHFHSVHLCVCPSRFPCGAKDSLTTSLQWRGFYRVHIQPWTWTSWAAWAVSGTVVEHCQSPHCS